jgi:MFS family permease
MNAPAPSKNRPVRVAGIRRGCVTWYSYLTLGFFTYLLNIQGNILPFLKAELDLSYRAVSLHSSALAAGLIAVGLFGDRVIRRYGRRRALRLGAAGISAGAVLLCLAPVAWASIGSCALMGRWGPDPGRGACRPDRDARRGRAGRGLRRGLPPSATPSASWAR